MASANGVLLLLTSGLETGFSLLARGSILSTEEGEDSSQSRLFFDLDFWPPVAYFPLGSGVKMVLEVCVLDFS